MVVHSFQRSLDASHAQEDAPWWEDVYRKAFPNFACMNSTRNDGWWQRGGIDRVVTLTNSKQVLVDEKVRYRDYGDILLEYWSNYEERKKGWVALDLACDFIAYAIVPTTTCYLLPFIPLRQAWRDNHDEWSKKYKIPPVPNDDGRGGVYHTHSVAIRRSVLFDAMRDSMCVSWNTKEPRP